MQDKRYHYLTMIIILCLVSSVSRFAIDSYLPSLPAIAANFHLSQANAQMTLTLYLLGFSISQLIYGPFSDTFGRKKILLIGCGIFLLGTMGCIFADSATTLLLARFVSGLGAGACGVLNRAIASDCFKGAEFSKAWSYTTTTLVLTLILAPVMGGYTQTYIGWYATFYLCLIYVAAVWIIVYCVLPETHQTRQPLHFKKTLHNYRRILSSYTFLAHTLCYTLAFGGLIAYFQVSPFLFIEHFGLTPIQYGWSSVVIAGSYFLGGFIVRRFAHTHGTAFLLQRGILILIIGGALMQWASDGLCHHWIAVLISMAVYVVGARMVIPNAMAEAMVHFRAVGGTASALMGCIQMMGAMSISFLVAQCDVHTALSLAWCLMIAGCMSLILFYGRGLQAIYDFIF